MEVTVTELNSIMQIEYNTNFVHLVFTDILSMWLIGLNPT